jgi:hypothetical protein
MMILAGLNFKLGGGHSLYRTTDGRCRVWTLARMVRARVTLPATSAFFIARK